MGIAHLRRIGAAVPQRVRAGEMIDRMLAREGRTAPFTGREPGILVNVLATRLAVQLQHEPDAVDPARW